MTISTILHALEQFAPPALQESWDNTGLQLGSVGIDCTGVLICLDVSPEVVDEAIERGCNLIISHHPLFFKGVKRLTGATPSQSAALKAIRADITIYSTHTAIDSTPGGVSYELARLIGVEPLHVLAPAKDRLVHLQVIAPTDRAETVRDALFDAGAGDVGNYDCCAFSLRGSGTFRPKDGAAPYTGTPGETADVDETEINVVLPTEKLARVESVLREVHPYEEPAFTFTPMLNTLPRTGLGIYGTLDDGLTPDRLVERVKTALGIPSVRCSAYAGNDDVTIRRVALCGGAGGEFIPAAIASGAQAYITADVRYHDFQTYGNDILIIDAGHYQTETPIKNVILHIISQKFPNFAVAISQRESSPMIIC